MTDLPSLPVDRRSLIRGGAALALAQALPGWAATGTHGAAQGALSSLFAATAAEAEGGRYYGPTGAEEKRGPLGLAKVPEAAADADDAARLWSVAERLTGVRYG